MSLLDRIEEALKPHHEDTGYGGLPVGNVYDDDYPGEAAGHAEAAAVFADEPVRTTTGYDIGYDGDAQHRNAPVPHEGEGVGSEHVNDAIRSVVKDAHKAEDRLPVSDVADDWRCDTILLKSANRVYVIRPNPNRRSITITNQSAAAIAVGKYPGITSVGGPGTASIPAGGFRTFTHAQAIYIIGPLNSQVDYVEEFDYR